MNVDGSKYARLFRRENLLTLVAAGGVGELALEFFAWWIVPATLGKPMRPDVLVADLARSLLHVDISVVLAVSLHLAAGILIFPLLFVVARAAIGFKTTLIPAAVYGVILWLVAQAVLAPLAGRPVMLGWIANTWASLVGHVLYAVVFAHALVWLTKGPAEK